MFSGLIQNIILFAFEGEGWQAYLPVETLAKIINLVVFVGLMYFFLRRPISAAFNARREGIRKDLLRAQEERNVAVSKLEEVEGRLQRLDAEVEAVRAQAQREADAELQRIARSTEDDIRKLREQSQREIESAVKIARAELRAYAAEQSVKMAEEMIRRDIRPEDDARLVREYVEELGGVKH
ncbi:MAG: ATP synthase F0 subunit B [Pyrinomonadaceae bacterium]